MWTEAQKRQLAEGAQAFGLTLNDTMLEQCAHFAALLEETNRTLNLTRVPPEEYVTLHFLDSLSLAAALTPKPGERLLDVGTGAGFPGLPLAIAFPHLDVTLLDGTRKRLAFLDAVIAELGLANARALHGRAEEICRLPAYRGRFDIVTARAVAKLGPLAEWLLPFAKAGGLAVAYKSREADAEIAGAAQTIARRGGTLEAVREIALPGTEIARKLIVIRKRQAGPLPGLRPRKT